MTRQRFQRKLTLALALLFLLPLLVGCQPEEIAPVPTVLRNTVIAERSNPGGLPASLLDPRDEYFDADTAPIPYRPVASSSSSVRRFSYYGRSSLPVVPADPGYRNPYLPPQNPAFSSSAASQANGPYIWQEPVPLEGRRVSNLRGGSIDWSDFETTGAPSGTATQNFPGNSGAQALSGSTVFSEEERGPVLVPDPIGRTICGEPTDLPDAFLGPDPVRSCIF